MGVPKFYRWLSERYPCLSEVISNTQIPEFDNLYLDMNGIIHNCSHPNDDDVTFRISEEQIMNDIFAYIDKLYRIIRPQKVFFMAVDGVAPRAKMNQQRARRFMSARTDQEQEEKAKAQKQELPSEKRFDKNCITPGTTFMVTLHERLCDWIEKKVNNDSTWQGPRIFLSGHNCPGEGEHKIMDFIRTEKTDPNYDPNTRHCMYGLDADLIMLGMVSHEPHFSLLREEVKFTPPSRGKKKKLPAKRTSPANTTFHLLHLSLLREYLSWEFRSLESVLPFDYETERVIDDWILMGFLIGNDFLPHLPNIHIHDDALPFLYDTYKRVLPTLDGYINESGYLNLKRFEIFLKAVAMNDRNSFVRVMEDAAYLRAKKGASQPGAEEELMYYEEEDLQKFEDSDMENDESDNQESISNEDLAFVTSDEEDDLLCTTQSDSDPIASASELLADHEEDPVVDEVAEALALADFKDMDEREFENRIENIWSRAIGNEFKKHKRNYYSEKLKLKNITRDQVRQQSEGYVRAIQWVLHYYYHGCVSWSWYFPHHYAPYISDVVNFADMDLSFELSEPFKPFEQLLAVLPESSGDCIPKVLRELMQPESVISDFYPTNFETDLNGKKNDWEAVVLIPFIDEKRLLSAISEKMNLLTDEEKKRNSHGDHLLFQYSTAEDEQKKAIVTHVDKDKFRIPREKVVWGLLPEVKLDVFFPGFPTMKHIPHKAYLKKINVCVFQSNSTRPSMILEPVKREALCRDLLEVAFDLIDKEVFVDWPILKMGKVFCIWGPSYKYQRQRYDEVTQIKLTEDEIVQYHSHVRNLRDRQLHRYAINVEEVEAVVFVKRLLGVVYETKEDKVVPVKQWSSESSLIPVLLPLLVTDIKSDEGRQLKEMSVMEAYPPKSRAFVMEAGWKGFGFPTIIEEYTNKDGFNRAVVTAALYDQPDIGYLKSNDRRFSLHWFPAFEAGRRSGVGRIMIGRLTAFIPLIDGNREEFERNNSYKQKINVGLSLRSSKQGLEAPNYTKFEDGNWSYSSLCVRVLTEYKCKFNDLLSYMDKRCRDDAYFASEIWPDEELRVSRLEALSTFLSDVVSKNAELKSFGSQYVDNIMIAHVEECLEKTSPSVSWVKSVVNPSKLFRAELFNGKVLPEPNVDFQLLDRVVNVSSFSNVPFGLQGTVVGIQSETIEVLFDKAFKGAYTKSKLECCATVSICSLINITYGKERSMGKCPTKVWGPAKTPEKYNKAKNGNHDGSKHRKDKDNRRTHDFPKKGSAHNENSFKSDASSKTRNNKKEGSAKSTKPIKTEYAEGGVDGKKIFQKEEARIELLNILGIGSGQNAQETKDSRFPNKAEFADEMADVLQKLLVTEKSEPTSTDKKQKKKAKSPKQNRLDDRNTAYSDADKNLKTETSLMTLENREKALMSILKPESVALIESVKVNPEKPSDSVLPKKSETEQENVLEKILNLAQPVKPGILRILKREEKKEKEPANEDKPIGPSVSEDVDSQRYHPRADHPQSNYAGGPRDVRPNGRRWQNRTHQDVQHPKLTDLKPSTISKPIRTKGKKTNSSHVQSSKALAQETETEAGAQVASSKSEEYEDVKVESEAIQAQSSSVPSKKRTPRLAAKFGMN